MKERSWFWRKIGFWFVPVKAGTLRREEGEKMQRMVQSGRSRRARRFTVILWVGVLAFQAWVAYRGARLWAAAGLASTVLLLSIALFAFYRMRIAMAQPTLKDRSLSEYDRSFEALKEKQRGELFERNIRDGIFGRVRLDERDGELRRRSEADAYRLLRPGLAGAVSVYWAVCL